MPTTTTSAVRQLSDANPQGTAFGQSTTDLIGFYTNTPAGLGNAAPTPVVQPSGNAFAALARGQQGATVITFSSVQSPSGVTNLSTAEYSITVQNGTGGTLTPTTGDVWIVNKPTSQAGLGVGNIRQSSANVVGLSFQNYTGTMITPTASQAYGFVGLRGLPTVTAVLTPAAVAASTTAEQIFTVTGVRVGEVLIVSKPTTNVGLDIVGARVAANNSAAVTFVNVTAGVLTPTAGETYSFFSNNGIDAGGNVMVLGLNATLTPATVTASNVGNLTISSSNVNLDDTFMGAMKPTNQVSIGVAGGFTAAGVVRVQLVNPTVTVATPTASEIYEVSLYRPKPVAPCIIYSATITPASVAANTAAEQTFAVTGIVSGSVVVVNKPSAQAGLGVAGARVSSANNIAINFVNATATTITPASETYLIANWQELIDVTTGNSVAQSAIPADYTAGNFTAALRTALGPSGLNLVGAG